MNSPGKNFLKVTGVILIIFAVRSMAQMIYLFVFMNQIGEIGESASGTGTLLGIFILRMIAFIALYFFVGVKGIQYCDNIEKSGACFKLGVALVTLLIIDFIIVMFAGNVSLTQFAMFIVPVLYLVGAMKNGEQKEKTHNKTGE